MQADYCLGDYFFGAWDVIFKTESEVMEQFPAEMEFITTPDQAIEYLKMEKDLFIVDPRQLVEKYGWLNIYNPYDKPFSEEDFVNQRAEKNKSEIKKQFKNFNKVKSQFDNFLSTIKNTKLRKKVELVHAYAFLKTDRIDIYRQSIFALKDFHNYLCKLNNSTIDEVSQLSASETIVLLKGKSIGKDILNKRAHHHTMYHYYKNNINELDNPKQIEEIRKFLEDKNLSADDLKGMVACKGKVKGRVKIITHSSETKKVNKGDILVAKYTFPSFIPAMKKAAAIITDEGGLTSHAAIIAREINKPCIVGIKVATKVLKDGDIVEVDANKGIVKKT
ncbi:hypothetical protein K8R42_01460 [bacterium]|nr:hypothetical protein [bacterium]